MKTKFIISVFLIFTYFVSGQTSSTPYFPLEVGNRWDYYVERQIPGGLWFYDSVSITILRTEILPNSKEYFVFSEFPFHHFGYQNKYAREESGKIYFYLIEDSSDCLTFQFDIPQDSYYVNCWGSKIFTGSIYQINLWDHIDIQREQDIFYTFSEHYGIYHYWFDNLEYVEYYLMGCKISGQIFGNLIVTNDDLQPGNYNFELAQNYPNPFNPSTSIKYSIPQLSFVTLKVYDLLGKEVATLVNEEKQAGIYEAEFNGSTLPSGVYFYQLRVSALQSKDGKTNDPESSSGQSFVETKKMILLK